MAPVAVQQTDIHKIFCGTFRMKCTKHLLNIINYQYEGDYQAGHSPKVQFFPCSPL